MKKYTMMMMMMMMMMIRTVTIGRPGTAENDIV
jgi:hypothetical protein